MTLLEQRGKIMSEFIHLHVHSEYSLLDGACRLKRLVSRAKELNMSSVAVTDHGNVYAAVEFYNECKAQGIKPIIGCEVYVAPRSRFQKEGRTDLMPYHLILLCKDTVGYKNLCKLVSASYTEGFYGKPRIDFELLKSHSEGLICMSACLAGEVARKLTNGDYDGAKECAQRYKALFGDDYYIEVQDHGYEEQRSILPYQYKLARELGIKLCATNDCHYIDRTDARTQKILMCINTNTTEDSPDAMAFKTDEFYFKSQEEMSRLFLAHPEAISNTVEIANKCNLEFEFGVTKLPGFSIEGVTDNEAYLRSLCEEGLKNRYENPTPEAKARLEYELSVISRMGYVNYYLIVWDFIRYARSVGIPVGPGRGSGAGSLAAYCIGITGIDPLKYNLLFERFLNPERVSMPDFDIDFCVARRQEVIDYVKRRYGVDHVAQIITFGTMAAKNAIRDVARAMALPYSLADTVAKAVPFGMSIQEALDSDGDFSALCYGDEKITELIDMAKQVEGMPRHASTHAAGVVITDGPVSDYVPLQTNDGQLVTQYTMTVLERLGLLKIDFLGLRNLTVIRDAEDHIKLREPGFSIENIPFDDPEVFAMLSRGDTSGVFQFESSGMTSTIVRLVPETLEDLIAVISLYRPGPMDSIPTYIRNRHNPSLVSYSTPLLKPILDVTYGCIVYQEQVMQIFRELAGYSYGRADVVRRAMAKKKHSVLEAERKAFVFGDESCPGCVKNGVPEEVANRLFDDMLSFASYAFNKSHAAAYAVVAYETAYLKCHYFSEYMAALLTSVLESASKVTEYSETCKTRGVKILPPDINLSGEGFTSTPEGIRFGLLAVKSLGSGFIRNIIAEKESGGKFKSLYDFVSRMHGRELNSKAVEALIKSGAFDGFPHNRREMLESLEAVVSSVAEQKRENLDGQLDFFGGSSGVAEPDIPSAPEYSLAERLEMEKETIGIYVSGHPLSGYVPWLSAAGMTTVRKIADAGEKADGKPAAIIGILRSRNYHTDKKGSRMCFAVFEDVTSDIEAIVFSRTFERFGSSLETGESYYVGGRVSVREEEPAKLIADEIIPVDAKLKELSKMSVGVKTLSYDYENREKLRALAKSHPGANKLMLWLSDVRGRTVLKGAETINLDAEVLAELESIFGLENVRLK